MMRSPPPLSTIGSRPRSFARSTPWAIELIGAQGRPTAVSFSNHFLSRVGFEGLEKFGFELVTVGIAGLGLGEAFVLGQVRPSQCVGELAN